ncbi:PIR Superfamily Protein [Plasmodium ovale wallikeri]|uniref:PIR Superfamily Protein n=1 Tax=Plasmodium ovale wallikeri TaxID=864142 RepID=A0A1A9AQK5_PLAOA|nr:PIR Superfamily Protein [Plasmodium ovale wallikeri]
MSYENNKTIQKIFHEVNLNQNAINEMSCSNIESYIKKNVEYYRDPCKKISKYLNHLEEIHESTYVTKGCKYLNYLLYEKMLMNRKDGYSIQELYENLKDMNMEIGYLDENICENHIEEIKHDIYVNLKELYELYEKFNKLKNGPTSCTKDNCACANECANLYFSYEGKCNGDYHEDFCNELENFRGLYNDQMKNENCRDNAAKTLKSFKKNNTVIILIPFILILVTSVFSFIFYKFTPYGSWIFTRIMKKRRTQKYVYHETLELQHIPEKTNRNLRNDEYNIKYNNVGNDKF